MDSVALGDGARYVRWVRYYGFGDTDNYMITCCPDFSSIPTILVFQKVFKSSMIRREDDLLSLLVDHELIHAKQIYEEKRGRLKKNPIENELEAYRNQLEAIKSNRRYVSPELLEDIERKIKAFESFNS